MLKLKKHKFKRSYTKPIYVKWQLNNALVKKQKNFRINIDIIILYKWEKLLLT